MTKSCTAFKEPESSTFREMLNSFLPVGPSLSTLSATDRVPEEGSTQKKLLSGPVNSKTIFKIYFKINENNNNNNRLSADKGFRFVVTIVVIFNYKECLKQK